MTDQEINIAIAECCGWRVKLNHPESKYAPWSLIAPSGNTIVDCTDENDGWSQTHRYPNYTTNLNAMHEAEKFLKSDQCEFYHLKLGNMTNRAWHATARQRAEAFLRTLGKWKE